MSAATDPDCSIKGIALEDVFSLSKDIERKHKMQEYLFLLTSGFSH